MAFKITQEKDKCIGCGACVALDPENWDMGGGKADLKGGKDEGNEVFTKTIEEKGNAESAVNACPVSCLKIEEA